MNVIRTAMLIAAMLLCCHAAAADNAVRRILDFDGAGMTSFAIVMMSDLCFLIHPALFRPG